MERPSPVPCPSGLVVKNGSKIRFACSGRTPGPESVDPQLRAPRPRPAPQPSVIRPAPAIAWIALTRRFSAICWSWFALPRAVAAPKRRTISTRPSLSCGCDEEERLLEDLGEVHRALLLVARAPREAEQALDDPLRAHRRVLDEPQVLGVLGGPVLLAHELREREDPAERVVDLVRDPAGELPDRRHLLGVEEAAGDLALVRHVLEHDDHRRRAPPPRTGRSGRARCAP